jgi:hypothetical protein
MKPRLLITLLTLALAQLCFGASPEEESRFLTAVRDAYARKDQGTIIALTCWDGVTEKHRRLAPKVLEHALSRSVKSVQYGSLDTSEPHTYTKDGITYGPNLPVTKQIEIEYEGVPGSPRMKSTIYAGEKEGKLMIVNFAPQQ